jgi:hypothetical protein
MSDMLDQAVDEISRLGEQCRKLSVENITLKAEVEKLTAHNSQSTLPYVGKCFRKCIYNHPCEGCQEI